MLGVLAVSHPRLKPRVTSDGLAAFLSVAAGDTLTIDELEAELAAAGVRSGVIEEVLTRLGNLLMDPAFSCDEELIAVGHAALSGTDAWFEARFAEGLQAGHLRDDGSVDYHDRELLKPVHRGDVVGIIHSALPGSTGKMVDGTLIPTTLPRPLALKLLDGVERGDELAVRATRDGVILYKAGQSLDVVDRHHHQGPVDLHSGDLHMQGSLIVGGDVLRPFSVSATGDLEILGNIDSASVQAGGSLRVRGGIRGGDGGAVCAEGDLSLHHAESAELYAGGAIRLQEAINTLLQADAIHATGRVRGGVATAERRLEVKEAGSPSGVDTVLIAGEPLESPLAAAQRSVARAKAARLSERVRGRSSDRTKGGKAGRAKAELEAEKVTRLRDRAARRELLLESAAIQVTLAHPGVSIRIGDVRLNLEESTRATRFSLDRNTSTLRIEKPSP